MKKRKLFLFVPVILWMAVIYWFSANNGVDSSSQSAVITYGIAACADKLLHLGLTESGIMMLADSMSFIVRKTAHFSEYMILALFVRAALAGCFIKLKPVVQYCITIAWVFLYAALDELHQYFVPGRYCSIKDVFIDTAGGLFGIIIVIIVRHIRKCVTYNKS